MATVPDHRSELPPADYEPHTPLATILADVRLGLLTILYLTIMIGGLLAMTLLLLDIAPVLGGFTGAVFVLTIGICAFVAIPILVREACYHALTRSARS